jgi:DNA-binding response OmpR family regulator
MKSAERNRVLIIDDDSSICEILTEVLEDENFAVKVLHAPAGIHEAIQEFRPDLFLIDYLIPDINGGEICHQLKSAENSKHLPVIMYSAHPRVIHSLGNYGWDLFVEKPFDVWDLVEKIKLCISNSKYRKSA